MKFSLSAWSSMVALLACTQAPASSTPAPVTAAAPAPAPPAAAMQMGRPGLTPEQTAARNDSLRQDRMMYVNRIRAQIAGKENLPAEEVFQNIKMLKGSTAGRLLGVMSGGYSNSLGVSCSHCHVTDDFSKEDKPTKQITRDMSAMVRVINDPLLRNIKNIKSESPGVNCGTCHNGTTRPGFGPQQQQRAPGR